MKISIVGLGTMGKLVQQEAQESQISIVSTIDPFNPEADFKEINSDSLKDADACICFTTPDTAFQNIVEIAQCQKNIVMATTGWIDRMQEAKEIIKKNNIAMIYSSNFSLGVNLFFKIVETASALVNQFDDYDVLGYEFHHNRKTDSPSGTAKTLENIILDSFTKKQSVVEEKLDRKIDANEFHFASIRGGDIPGEHSIRFESTFDSIELKHTARNRSGFAKGSLLATQWIQNKKGIFTEKDLMQHYINSL